MAGQDGAARAGGKVESMRDGRDAPAGQVGRCGGVSAGANWPGLAELFSLRWPAFGFRHGDPSPCSWARSDAPRPSAQRKNAWLRPGTASRLREAPPRGSCAPIQQAGIVAVSANLGHAIPLITLKAYAHPLPGLSAVPRLKLVKNLMIAVYYRHFTSW